MGFAPTISRWRRGRSFYGIMTLLRHSHPTTESAFCPSFTPRSKRTTQSTGTPRCPRSLSTSFASSKRWTKSCTRRWPKTTKMDGKHPRSSNKRETQNGEPSNKWAPAADEREQQLSKQDISSYYDY